MEVVSGVSRSLADGFSLRRPARVVVPVRFFGLGWIARVSGGRQLAGERAADGALASELPTADRLMRPRKAREAFPLVGGS